MATTGEESGAALEAGATCGIGLVHLSAECGRPVHPAPEHDEVPVCLMHFRDPDKDEAAFHEEIERILAEAERTDAVADFTYFVFPAADYEFRVFAPACNFSQATFTQNANFFMATFTQDADFSMATFTQNATFYVARFTQEADFPRATFTQNANFSGATFTQNATFSEATFTQEADFPRATFTQNANFSWARFTQDADFSGATFTQDAVFSVATFTQDADFSRARFARGANFSLATISGEMRFRETKFPGDPEAGFILDLSEMKVEHPEWVEFYQTDLSCALLLNTDVSKFDFALVTWGRRGEGSGRLSLFEEVVSLARAADLRPPPGSADERNYALIAETYQQLKRNYDARGDYWTAGHWHYGEMEMQRLHSDWRPGWARRLHRHLSLVALYRYASAYGESYTLPLLWLAGIVVFFALIYPLAGLALHVDNDDVILQYWNRAEFFRQHADEHPQGFFGVLLHGAMASLSVAGFQRELRYAPAYPWGRLLALVEVLLTTTLGGLFALAIRRQFKRS